MIRADVTPATQRYRRRAMAVRCLHSSLCLWETQQVLGTKLDCDEWEVFQQGHRRVRHAKEKGNTRVTAHMLGVQGSPREAVPLARMARWRLSRHQLCSEKARPALRLRSRPLPCALMLQASLRGHLPALGFRIALRNVSDCVWCPSGALVSPGSVQKCKWSVPGHKTNKSKSLGVGPYFVLIVRVVPRCPKPGALSHCPKSAD